MKDIKDTPQSNISEACTACCCGCSHKRPLALVLVAIFLAATLVGGGVFAYKWYLSSKSLITVVGSSTDKLKNQVATFSATVDSQNKDKNIAVNDANAKSTKVVDALKKFGITADNIKTNNVSIYQMQEPYYEDGTTRYRPGSWTASISIEVKLEEVERASDLASLLASLEISNVWGPNLTVDNTKVDEAKILADAVSDAEKKAKVLAAKSGKKLDKIVSIVEGGSSSQPPVYFDLMKSSGMGGGGGMPIEPGTTSVSKTVTVTFSVR